MKQSARVWIWILAIAAAAGAGLCVWGLASGNEPILAVGLPVAFLSVLFLPVLLQRKNKQSRIMEGEGLLARWEYMPDEAALIAAAHRKQAARRCMKMALLFFICITLILLPFTLILGKDGSLSSIVLASFALALLCPWAAAAVAPALQARAILRQPCVTVIDRSCLLIANRYHALNDYNRFSAEGAKFIPAGEGSMARLSMRYSYRAGRRLTRFTREIDVPVPMGREREAEDIIKTFHQ